MRCPACPDSTLAMTERSGVEIDYCPTCRGIWLDRGELDKLIERADAPPVASHLTRDERHRRDDRDRDRDRDRDERWRTGAHEPHRPKKRTSLLGELFDF